MITNFGDQQREYVALGLESSDRCETGLQRLFSRNAFGLERSPFMLLRCGKQGHNKQYSVALIDVVLSGLYAESDVISENVL